MINPKGSVGVVALLTSAVMAACAQLPGEEQSQPLGEATQGIIGGTAVTSSAYAAVGALVYYHPEVGVLDVFCSGTLVASKAITTARHCTPSIDVANESGLVPAFAIGPDAFNPSAVIPITNYTNAPAAPPPEFGLL